LNFLPRNDDGRYALTTESETFLVRNKPAYRGDFFTFVPGMIQHWLNLKEVVKSGEPVGSPRPDSAMLISWKLQGFRR
jgi:hypothetical protein